MYYRCKHFCIQELVSPDVYKFAGVKAWLYLDPYLLRVLDRIVDKWGVTIINTWKWKGNFDLRGFRHPGIDAKRLKLSGINDKMSLHQVGRAFDMHFKNTSVAVVRDYIRNNPAEFPEIKGIEIASWLHIDSRNSNKVIVFTP